MSGPVMPQMPAMLDLAAPEDDEDASEENKMMAILVKLKTAKSAINNARKRKHNERLAKEATVQMKHEISDTVGKFKKKWATKVNAIQSKIQGLKTKTGQCCQSITDSHAANTAALATHHQAIHHLWATITALETDCQQQSTRASEQTREEAARAKEEVGRKLQQLHFLLQRTHSDSAKDDRFTSLFKKIISTV